MYPSHIRKLMEYFMQLPGVGPKTASKYVFDLLNWNNSTLEDFMNSVIELKKTITKCHKCYNYCQKNLCEICANEKRDHSIVCVVAHYPDLLSIENLDEYNGLYHILQGNLNPLEGITPDRLTIQKLFERIENNEIQEIILALNPDIPGESTALYLINLLKKHPKIKVTRIAKGLPMGSTLEYADQTTISNALKGRTSLNT